MRNVCLGKIRENYEIGKNYLNVVQLNSNRIHIAGLEVVRCCRL